MAISLAVSPRSPTLQTPGILSIAPIDRTILFMMNVKKKGSKRMTMKIPRQTLGGCRATPCVPPRQIAQRD
jgi:hypothetical protein